MLKAGGQLNLALESLSPEIGCELRVEHFEGDGSIVSEVMRQEDRGHAPAAELTLQTIPFGKVRLKNLLWSLHRTAW